MAQLDTIRLPDGREVKPGDWTCTPLYSTVEIDDAATLADLNAFSYGIGGDVPGSTGPRQSDHSDTNMQGQGSVLSENEELLIFGICIELLQFSNNTTNFFTTQEAWAPDPPLVSATNCQRVLQDTLVEMWIASTKNYLAIPIGFLPGARGVYHTFGSARTEGSAYIEAPLAGYNGNVSEHMHRRFATPQQVGGGEAFAIKFRFPFGSVRNLDFGTDTTARILARVYTRGARKRPVA